MSLYLSTLPEENDTCEHVVSTTNYLIRDAAMVWGVTVSASTLQFSAGVNVVDLTRVISDSFEHNVGQYFSTVSIVN